MTTTYLFIKNMVGKICMEVVGKILREAGYNPISIQLEEVKIGWNFLSKDELKRLKEKLLTKGFEIIGICQTTWAKKAVGANVL